jgi:hypothetical protein
MHTSLVAGLDEQLDVCVHKGARHGDGVSVGEDEVGVLAETLDGAEDVVPATAVEARGVVAELVDDLVLLVCVMVHALTCHTSSISKAAVMVSIKTVPRMVPRFMPM